MMGSFSPDTGHNHAGGVKDRGVRIPSCRGASFASTAASTWAEAVALKIGVHSSCRPRMELGPLRARRYAQRPSQGFSSRASRSMLSGWCGRPVALAYTEKACRHVLGVCGGRSLALRLSGTGRGGGVYRALHRPTLHLCREDRVRTMKCLRSARGGSASDRICRRGPSHGPIFVRAADSLRRTCPPTVEQRASASSAKEVFRGRCKHIFMDKRRGHAG